MTEHRTIKRIETIKHEYMKNRNREKARALLQDVFAECFEQSATDEIRKVVLSKAYALLRRIENDAPVSAVFPYRYDIAFLTEELVFCAQTISQDTLKRFTLNYDFESAYVSVELQSMCRIILSLLANAMTYSDEGQIEIRLSVFDSFVSINVNNTGCFEAEDFQKALKNNGSLGFIFRVLSDCGGSVIMTDGGNTVSVAVKIPLCERELPFILPFAVEDLLLDRLSVLYVSFCGH